MTARDTPDNGKTVRRALIRAATPISGMSNEEGGYGIIDAGKLLD